MSSWYYGGFSGREWFHILKKLYRDGLQTTGKAHSLFNENCMTCCTPLLPVHEGGDINWLWYVFEKCAFDGGSLLDHSQWSIGALPWCITMWWILWVWMIEAFGPDCLAVNDRSIRSGVCNFSALSWESVEVMFLLTINISFWWGLKIDSVLPLRWAVSGRMPTYQRKVASKLTGYLP